MIIAKDDEKKRSRIWAAVTIIASVLIVFITVFFLMKLFTSNPLEGNWESEDTGLMLSIKSNDSMVVSLPEVSGDTDVELKMSYSINRDRKTITIKGDETAFAEVAEASKGQYTEEILETAFGSAAATFDYSVDGGQLTLTEREYGEQMVFKKH